MYSFSSSTGTQGGSAGGGCVGGGSGHDGAAPPRLGPVRPGDLGNQVRTVDVSRNRS